MMGKVELKTMLNLLKHRKKRKRNKERQTLTKMMKMVMKKEEKEQQKKRRRETAKKRLQSYMHQGNKTTLTSECLVAGPQETGNKPLTIQSQFNNNFPIVILLRVNGWTTQVILIQREPLMLNTELKTDFKNQELMT